MTNQKNIFLQNEGDMWFQRNHETLINTENFIDIDLISKYLNNGYNILEIGCSNGHKLNYLNEKNNELKLKLFGVDPSNASINNGKNNFQNIDLSVGTADSLNFEDEYFDIIIVGFCMYLVDRSLLFKSIAEIDRVLKTNGILVITDFDPPYPICQKYHHNENISSYKNCYPSFFTSGNHYSIIEKIQYTHKSPIYSAKVNDRVGTTLLLKESVESIYRG